MRNRRLLVSVFDPQEAREAIIGGGRIIDCEDPRTSLGNISPIQIMRICEAVVEYKRDLNVQTSTNIGEEQLLFDKSETGLAIQKFENEIAGKAAQAALGVSCAMGTDLHRTNIVKIGIDAMSPGLVEQTLRECVLTLKRSDQFNKTSVVAVFFIRSPELWLERKNNARVIRELIELKEFYFDEHGEIELKDIMSMAEIAKLNPPSAKSTKVSLNPVVPYEVLGYAKSHKDVLREVINICARSGVDGLMIDTSIQHKVIKVSSLKHSSNGMEGDLKREGILDINEVRWFAEYCHYQGIQCYVAGSIQASHAKALWEIEDIDSLAVRGGASGNIQDPDSGAVPEEQARHKRRIRRDLVRLFAPPDQAF